MQLESVCNQMFKNYKPTRLCKQVDKGVIIFIITECDISTVNGPVKFGGL